MFRRKFTSLSVRISADWRQLAASASATLARSTKSMVFSESDVGGIDKLKRGREYWDETSQIENDKGRLLVLDEDSEDDIQPVFCVPTTKRKSCCERTHLWSLLQGHLSKQPAKTVTSERKYAVHPGIAEFWCMVTSPVYFLPFAVVYQCGGISALPPTALYALTSTGCTAMASLVYHAFNTELYSLLDVILAFNTQLSFTICGLEHVTNSGVLSNYFDFTLSSMEWLTVSLVGTFVLFFLFALSPFPELMPILVFGLLFAPTMWWLYMASCWTPMISMCLGTVCFVTDRLGFFPTHSLWHIAGATGLYSVLAFSVHADEQCGREVLFH